MFLPNGNFVRLRVSFPRRPISLDMSTTSWGNILRSFGRNDFLQIKSDNLSENKIICFFAEFKTIRLIRSCIASMLELDKHNNENNLLVSQVAQIIREARQTAYRAVNFTMVLAYWNIGKLIVEDELHWERADYGKAVLRNLSQRLTKEFGKGFDERELRKMCQFYRCFEIRDTLRPELSSPRNTNSLCPPRKNCKPN